MKEAVPMIQEEKERLLALFDDEAKWCQGVDAADEFGESVHYDDENAVSWDLVGGLCHLFGWKRACALFRPISRYVTKLRHTAYPSENQEMAAMSALLDFNDDEDTTYELVISRLRELPVWHRIRAAT